MALSRTLLRLGLPAMMTGAIATWSAAQVELPAMETSGSRTSTLQRPTSWEPAPRPTTSLSGSSSSRGTSKIPDPSLFDGSAYPEEQRPEQAMIAQYEMPGGEPDPATQNEPGPGQQPGAGGPGPGGDGEGSGGGGVQLSANLPIPGLPPLMGGGGTDPVGQGGLPAIAESQMGDPTVSGLGNGGGGDESSGEPAAPGAPGAPPPPDGQQGSPLERPSAVPIGDENAKLAEAGVPPDPTSQSLENQPGETRMSVKAASGNQTTNRDKGTEHGVDIPSNL